MYFLYSSSPLFSLFMLSPLTLVYSYSSRFNQVICHRDRDNMHTFIVCRASDFRIRKWEFMSFFHLFNIWYFWVMMQPLDWNITDTWKSDCSVFCVQRMKSLISFNTFLYLHPSIVFIINQMRQATFNKIKSAHECGPRTRTREFESQTWHTLMMMMCCCCFAWALPRDLLFSEQSDTESWL